VKRRWVYIFAVLACALLAGCGGTWSSGDRVLVAKFLYDTGLQQPNRWDVVVFRYPKMPIDNGTPKNYIKRLLGLGGELLALFFGRIYKAQVPLTYPEDRAVDPRELWQAQYLHSTTLDPAEPSGRAFWEKHRFEIVRKPVDTLLAMRRIVYDNDHPATDLQDLPPRWAPVSAEGAPAREGGAANAWTPDGSHGFRHPGQNGQLQWLRYRHIHRTSGGKAQLITDFLGYNTSTLEGAPPKAYDPHNHNWVGDLTLECTVTVERAEGELCLELSKGVDRFQAAWDLRTGECALYRLGKRGERSKELGRQPTRLKGTGEHQLRFANVDARLAVWVDRDLPFGEGVTYHEPREWGPQENDLQPASIGSKGAAVRVHHLRLWRDTYYIREVDTLRGGVDVEPKEDDPKVDYSEPTTWQALRRLKYRTLFVQPRHYLCLGDNSPQSSDSRDWGTVPERLMLGRALMVYFPFDRAGRIR
jgi:signal peptidase I